MKYRFEIILKQGALIDLMKVDLLFLLTGMKKRILFTLLIVLGHLLVVSAQNTLSQTSELALYDQAMELLEREKYGAARTTFEKYIQLYPNDFKVVDAKYFIAYSALNLFHPDAESLFQEFINNYPYHSKTPLAYYELGGFYYRNKNYKKAAEYLQKVNTESLSPEAKLETQFKLAYSLFSQKEFDRAGELFDNIKKSEHKYTYAANYYAGYIELRNGKYDEALVDLKKAETHEEYKNVVPYMIVNVLYRQEKYDDLIAYAEKILKSGTKVQDVDELYLLTGESYYHQNNYEKASEYFKKYYKEKNKIISPDIHYRLALSDYKLEDYTSAIESFKQIASAKDTLGQSAAYFLGLSYLKIGNKDFALQAFERARKSDFNKETQREALYYYGKVNFDLGRYSEAIAALKEYVKDYPETVHINEVNELLSEAFLRSNNYAEALSYIESLRTRTSKINAAYQRIAFYRGEQLFNNGQYNEAIELFEKSLQYPNDKQLVIASHFWKGEAYSILKELEKAVNSYAQVFQLSDESSTYFLKARYGIGYAYYNLKQFDKALPHFREYVKQLKGADNKQFYNDGLLRLADLYYVTKNYKEAVRYYDEAIEQKVPETDYAYFQKGVVLGLDNKPEEAKASFDVVIKKYPNSLYLDNALFQKGQLELENGNTQQSIAVFSTLINSHPNSDLVPFALSKRAIAYNNLQKYNEAIEDYKTILDVYSGHEVAPDALSGIQEALVIAGRSEEFHELLTRYKNLYPETTNYEALEYENALSLYNIQKYKKAIEVFNNFLNNYPNSAKAEDARYYIAESYYRMNEFDKSIESFKPFVHSKISPYYTKAVNRLADMNLEKERYDTAKYYYVLLMENPKNKKELFNAWTGLVESYYYLNMLDSSFLYAEKILSHGNPTVNAENIALLFSGKVAYAKEEYDKALDFFISTVNVAKDVHGAEAQYLIAEVLHKQEKYKQSLETLYDLNKNFSSYQYWVGRSFLLIADNFIAMDEIFQAKATLNSIVEKFPDKEIVGKAKSKLYELERKETSAQ
ncbi:MAG TPA: tetratricopeptide repeat protein [Cytophagaceae bacterium]